MPAGLADECYARGLLLLTLTTLSSTYPVTLLSLGSFGLRLRAQPFLRLRLQHDEGVQHGRLTGFE